MSMRIAVLSDIHGNLEALQAVVADFKLGACVAHRVPAMTVLSASCALLGVGMQNGVEAAGPRIDREAGIL